MARDKRKKIMIMAAIALIVLVSIATVALMKGLNSDEQDPYKQADTSSTVDTEDTPDTETTQPDSTESDEAPTSESSIDPASLGTIDIAPMSIVVSYIKGVGSVEYQVLRTPNGTQYVEFRSPELIGTKCTDDEGAFASILADPKSDESATLAKKTTVDSVTYGLSLAADSCTSDAGKLKSYQDSFSGGFSLLKKME